MSDQPATDPKATGPALPIADGDGGLTPDQSALIAKGLYRPTVERIVVLLQTLVDATAAGDFALWAPLAAMEQVLLNLKFDRERPEGAIKLCVLAELALRKMGERLLQYAGALQGKGPTDPMPRFQEWTTDDTLAIYDQVEKLYPAAPPPSTPPAPLGPGTATEPPAVEPPGGAPIMDASARDLDGTFPDVEQKRSGS